MLEMRDTLKGGQSVSLQLSVVFFGILLLTIAVEVKRQLAATGACRAGW
jgi:hypothetical protein